MGIYVIKMDREQCDRLPAVFSELGLPKPSVLHKEGVVRYTFKLGVVRRLKLDLIEPEQRHGSYDLWIPLTRAGGNLFEGLKKRGYSSARQWHDSHTRG
jgi:hypothetical protein